MTALRTSIAVLALCVLSVSCLPIEEVREKRGTKTGAVLGALGGGAVGGKTGALAGAGVGALAGHELHKSNKHADQANANAAASSGAHVAAFEEEDVRVKREGAGKKTGALAGAVAGGVAAGPVGAIGGAILGGIAGHELHKHNHPKTEVIVPNNQGIRVKREGAGKKTGALAGAVAGGVAAGPVGAVGGAVLGAIAGHELHKVNHPKTEIAVPADHVRVRREGAGTKTGALGGAAIGAAAGGPIGAAVGAGVGAVAGHSIHDANKKADQANANSAAAVNAPRVKREGAGTLTGAAGGAVAGGLAAGPLGAAVGAGIGAVAGHAIHDANRKADQAVVNSAVASGQPVVVAQH